ncbi:hypothetical protein CRG98_026792 [Punica granatum]|uniref:Uncharacterized protein n=1 Tax=Punica granatum TaxID=22663 RepID=A0A2I0JAZ1_PUNGR|nr:hypothetical protein CRG98_026792 [Punica granatum]
MEFPWFDQACEGSSSRSKTHNHQDLPPKKRFCIKSSLTAWRPDHRQQLILDNLWASIKNPQKGEESINALVLHMEEQGNSKASLQQELCLKIDSLQQELSLQKAQTQAFLQNRHILEFSIPRISFYVFPFKDKWFNHHFDFCDLLKYGVFKSIILRPEDEHRPEYQSLFGNNAWDLIKKSLRRSSSLFISIESSPPEWISPIKVQPAIHYIFISPVSSRSVLTPEAKFWPADGQLITQISKWRAWVQKNIYWIPKLLIKGISHSNRERPPTVLFQTRGYYRTKKPFGSKGCAPHNQRNLRKRPTTTLSGTITDKKPFGERARHKAASCHYLRQKRHCSYNSSTGLDSTPHVSAQSKAAQRQGIHHCL